jgi:hypothetical protein
MPVVMIAICLSMFLVKYLAERFRMPQVRPWGQWTPTEEQPAVLPRPS